ncbi:hypothetical protein GT642_10465 [Butyricicoccus sp. BIOML-A1]|nr:hypothetical protein [Butyricicoccus sp. BIOML-A1]MZT27364.1 hypothetical protein [Butyricicoccus sp. BIOML-A1]
MTEVTPHPLKTQGFHHFLILLFYDHPPKIPRGFSLSPKKIRKNPKVFLAISEKSAILYLKQAARRRTGGIS